MDNQAKATPRPWYHDNADCKQKHLHNLCALVVDAEGTTVAHAFGDDAKIIVKAVNNHEQLLEACRSVKEIMRDYSYNFRQNESISVSRETLNEWMETLSQAIANVTK